MAKLRMGYVGCGYMAQKVHIPNILALEEDCELAAIAEVRPELGKKVQRRYNIPKLYTSHLELAQDDTVDAVGVSGSGTIQGDIARDLLLAGKDVFLEKPMAVSVRQADDILRAERESGRRLMIAYMKRYDKGNELIKSLLEQYRKTKEMGRLRYVRNQGIVGDWIGGLDTPFDQTDEPYPQEVVNNWPEWLPEKYYRGYYGYLQQWTHNINLLRWFLDAGEQVNVRSVTLYPDDGMTGVTVFDMAGTIVSLESGYLTCHEWNEQTQIYFDRGWVKTEMPTLLLRSVPAGVEVYQGDQEIKKKTRLFPKDGRSWMYSEEMKHFVNCILHDKTFRSPSSDAMTDVKLLEQIYQKYLGTVD
jgi:predicted dehydrogenase